MSALTHLVCCSYQALRMANFLTHPSLETIQSLLVITNVLSYNMNPGVAYIFLGLVVRMAFSMGIQINQSGLSDHESWLRRRVWWAIAWQDSHFAISYDRPTSSVLCNPDIPYAPNSNFESRSYPETMFNMIQLTQEVIRDRTLKANSKMSWAQMERFRDRVMQIVSDGAPHLRSRDACGNDQHQHTERLALKLHTGYMVSEICRPALKEVTDDATPTATPGGSPATTSSQRRKSSRTSSRSPPADPDLPHRLRSDCLRGLEGCVAAWVELCDYSKFAARSWVGIQRAISAAFLLGTVPEAREESNIQKLLLDLEKCLASFTIEDPGFDGRETNPNGDQLESSVWARSMTKSLQALRKLNATLAQPRTEYSHPGPMAVRGMYMDGASMRTAIRGPMLPVPHGQPAPLHTNLPMSSPRSAGYPSGPMTGVKQEPFSPTVGGSGMVMSTGPPVSMTPDGAAPHSAGGDWNYSNSNNMHDRASGFVPPPPQHWR
jgi:hypothetical protein